MNGVGVKLVVEMWQWRWVFRVVLVLCHGCVLSMIKLFLLAFPFVRNNFFFDCQTEGASLDWNFAFSMGWVLRPETFLVQRRGLYFSLTGSDYSITDHCIRALEQEVYHASVTAFWPSGKMHRTTVGDSTTQSKKENWFEWENGLWWYFGTTGRVEKAT